MTDVIRPREISAETLGRLLNVSARTVRQYAEKKMISRKANGKYEFPAVIAEYFGSLRDEIIFGPARGAGDAP
uniref:Uncharacterized protein n=1 Tax=Bosea sp. NBC_00436 TaxID=2969620 RepID=A0A9E7ZMV1_9HYPH